MNPTEQAKTRRPAYLDCLLGTVGVPTGKKQRLLFQALMIVSMVALMVTANWALRTPDHSWASFARDLPLYPTMLGIAVVVRLAIANPIIDKVTASLIVPHCRGFAMPLAIALANVLTMGSTIPFIRLLMIHGGFQGFYPIEYFSSLPLAYLMGFTASYFLVTPLVKLVFAKQIAPRIEARRATQER